MTQKPQPGGIPALSGRLDPLGLWLCGLAVLGLVRSWMYLVRDSGATGPLGWIWLGGSLLMVAAGTALLLRGLLRRSSGAAGITPAAPDPTHRVRGRGPAKRRRSSGSARRRGP